MNYSCISKDAIDLRLGSSELLDDETQERRETRI